MHNKMYNIPNYFTFSRIILIPVLIVVFYLPFAWAHFFAACIFALASFTDWLDGYLARKLHQFSSFGAFLDPVADKLLVASSLLLLVGGHGICCLTLPSIVIVGREIAISSLREWMAELGKRASVKVSYLGKLKTVFQMVAIFMLLAFPTLDSWWGWLGTFLLYLAAFLTLWSMIIYIQIAWPDLTHENIK